MVKKQAPEEKEELLTKSGFAKVCNVSPSTVSGWIKDGKISGDAIKGKGQRAKIRPKIAMPQLMQRLDISQQMGNGSTTNLQPGASSNEDDVASRLRAQKLTQAEINTRRALEEERARQGRYMLTVEARAEYAKLASALLDVFEGGVADIAATMAGQFKLPKRDVVHLLKAEFRKLRQSAADRLRSDQSKLAEKVADEQPEIDRAAG